MMEIFGFGDIFKDPTEFGLFKLFKGFMQLKPAGGGPNAGSNNASNGSGSGQTGGTGNPLIDLLGSFLPNIGGNNTGGISAPEAAGPAASPSLGNTVTAAALAPPGAQGQDATSVDNSFHLTVNNPQGDPDKLKEHIDNKHINAGANRSGIRNAPG